jgi:hypothetical protein
MPTDNHDLGKDAVGNTKPASDLQEGNPGYELTDVNVSGVVVFLAGLIGFVFVFFGFCFVMGRGINSLFLDMDGKATKWQVATGASAVADRRGTNLTPNTEMDQKDLQHMTQIFPTPRLDTDDGNQATADLHAREDLLLGHYSTIDGQPDGVRIPIDRAMELIVQRGLPVVAASAPMILMAGDSAPMVHAPLTSGFARTGFELDTIETREQKLSFAKAEGEQHAALTPQK